jgi:hypothetical protein
VKWLGDGLIVAFDSTADAVKCAIAMQQASPPQETASSLRGVSERRWLQYGAYVRTEFLSKRDNQVARSSRPLQR